MKCKLYALQRNNKFHDAVSSSPLQLEFIIPRICCIADYEKYLDVASLHQGYGSIFRLGVDCVSLISNGQRTVKNMDTLSTATSNAKAREAFHKDGVLVFKKLFSSEQLNIIADEISHIRKVVMAKIATMERPIKTYSDIAERHLGRFDYRCGFTADVFNEIAKPIVSIVNALSPRIDFRYYWGAIPSLSGSGPTDMHRDVYPILKDLAGDYDIDELDIKLPPYYFTVLMPLIQITPENGPTEFIKGSHKRAVVPQVEKEAIYAPLLSPGDIVIFDGRLLHRGSANLASEERMVAYLTFVANWYHDQSFLINHYLFPELAAIGR